MEFNTKYINRNSGAVEAETRFKIPGAFVKIVSRGKHGETLDWSMNGNGTLSTSDLEDVLHHLLFEVGPKVSRKVWECEQAARGLDVDGGY